MIAVDPHLLHHGLPTTQGLQSPGEKMKPPVAANLAAARPAPMPFGNTRAESQRDSAPKPRVAESARLPWEKRVVSANPNGVVARGRRWGTTPLGLKPARSLTQGSLADSATLGWRTQSLWDCRTIGLSVVPHGTGLARSIRKALRLARIFPPLERRGRARGLQPGGAPVGRVPSRGARLAFPSAGELSGLAVVRENVTA